MLIRPGNVTLDELQAIHAGGQPLVMDPSALPGILASAAVVRAAAEGDAAVYGVNTGFGKLASTRISEADLATLQLNLIRSHSVGVGEPLGAPVLRLMLATKAASLARGHSGVRPVVIDTLLAVYNAGLVPRVPSQGSVGASGDLAPLAHMTLALMGEGEFIDGGQRQPALPALQSHGIAPLLLSAKEGLALINGTQTSTALALHALFDFEPVLEAALVIGALTVDAARGSDGPFEPRIHALRGQPGQIDVARYYRELLAGSAIRKSHEKMRPQNDAARRSPPERDVQPWQSQLPDVRPRNDAARRSPPEGDVQPWQSQLLDVCPQNDAARRSPPEGDVQPWQSQLLDVCPQNDAARRSPPEGDVQPWQSQLLDVCPQNDAARRSPPEGDVQPWQSQLLDGDDRVQDPYCLRCQPQVVGACLDQLRHAARVLLIEANAVTDNPLVFAEDHAMVSGGNFHAEPVALAADAMACAIAEVGAIAERRIAMLIDSNVSRLPPFLTPNAGLNSGFMIAHVTAAALASENKSLAHPASVDSLPTSANQEDHVSMATFAARRLQPMIANVAHILGIEWLAAAQGVEFLRPLSSSPPLEQAHALLRSRCPAMMQDRYLAPDIEAATGMVRDASLARVLHGLHDTAGLPTLWTPA